jgi:hypothetical protein
MGTRKRPAGQAGRSHTTTAPASGTSVVIVDESTRDARPRCRVVGVYCEALYWLQREPLSRATACCRHYWADVEAAS